MIDLHVVGAGPSGCISAISAIHTHNANIHISEEHSKCGVPSNCSGLISKDGLNSLSKFVNYKKFILNKFNGSIINFAGEEIRIKRPSTVAYKLNRTLLDQEFASNAEKEGAKIKYKERIHSKFLSNNIIGADGPSSIVASIFGFQKIDKFVSTLQLKTKFKSEDPHKVELFYSNKQFPGFFGWSIPENEEYAEFGCGCVLPHNPRKGFEKFLNSKGISNFDSRKISPWIIPIHTRKSTSKQVGKRNVLLVGDAAGQIKSTTGGGLVFGGNCAVLAGKYYATPRRYEFEWRRKFGIDLFLHSQIQAFLGSRSENGLKNIGKLLKSTNLDSYFSKEGHMDKPSKMLKFDLIEHLFNFKK